MISKLLVANRGEIAARIMRTAHALGISTVAVHSDPDADAPFVALADEAVRLPGASPTETYLRSDLVIAAARATGADAVHPGYGFLSENADFAHQCRESKIEFVGPPEGAMRQVGNKDRAKQLARQARVPVVPGSDGIVQTDEEAVRFAARVGYPVLIKAAAGGGGRGMRVARNDVSLVGAYRPSTFSFGGHVKGVKPSDLAGWESVIGTREKAEGRR